MMVDGLPELLPKSEFNCWRIGKAWKKTWEPENNNWVNTGVNWANTPASKFGYNGYDGYHGYPGPNCCNCCWFNKSAKRSAIVLLPESILKNHFRLN